MKKTLHFLIIILFLNSCSTESVLPGKIADTLENAEEMTRPVTREQLLSAREKLSANKNSPQLRAAIARIEDTFLSVQLQKANAALSNDETEKAAELFGEIAELFPSETIGQQGLRTVAQKRRLNGLLKDARQHLADKNFDDSRRIARTMLLQEPNHLGALRLLVKTEKLESAENIKSEKITLAPVFSENIDIVFRRAAIDAILNSLSSSLDINFVIDQSVDGEKSVSVFIKETPLRDSLNMFFKANGLRSKAINERTMLIYDAKKINAEENRTIASFRVIHSDTSETASMLSDLLGINDVYVDEKLKLLVINGAPEKMALASRLIAMKDIPKPMVMLDLEVLEISRSLDKEAGLSFSKKFNVSPSATGSNINLDTLKDISSGQLQLSPIPSLGIGLDPTGSPSASKLLANPSMKILNGETGSINIGDKYPLVSSVTNNGVTSESISYVDVGIILSFTPTILPNGEIILDIKLEVSSVNDTIKTNSSTAYQIGNRSFNTKLRARDGETQLLGGLLRDEDRTEYSGIPFIISNSDIDRRQTEIVLSVTPRLFDHIGQSPEEDDRLFADIKTLILANKGETAEESITSEESESLFSHSAADLNTSNEGDFTHDTDLLSDALLATTAPPTAPSGPPPSLAATIGGDDENWNGASPLRATIYINASHDMENVAVVVDYNKNHFRSAEAFTIGHANIDQQVNDDTSGMLAVLLNNTPKGRYALAVVEITPTSRVLNETLLVIRSVAGKTADGTLVEGKENTQWRVQIK